MFAKFSNLFIITYSLIHFSSSEIIFENDEIETINFTHESCSRESHNTFKFTNFHETKPYIIESSSSNTLELLVRFKGIADGHILLTENPNVSEPLYMIILGSYNNKFTEIRRTKQAKPKVKILTPGILSPLEWRGFVIKYYYGTGRIEVLSEGSSATLISWDDTNPLNIKYYSFSGYRNRIVHVAFDCRAKDNYSSIPESEQGLSVEEIRNMLLDRNKYDVQIPPIQLNKPLQIITGLTVNYFSLPEGKRLFEVDAWLTLSWKDHRLQYNSSASNGTIIRFNPYEIWRPDLVLYNSAVPTVTENYGHSHVLVSPDGSVLWVPAVKYISHCPINLVQWPNDIQNCELKLGSWTHHGNEIDLVYISGNEATQSLGAYSVPLMVEQYNYISNSEWTLLENSVTRSIEFHTCCSEPFVDLTFTFKIQRNSPLYTVTLVFPIILISILNTILFLLPPQFGSKITIGSLLFFCISIYLIYFQSKLPALGDHIPLLVLLYIINLILVSVSIMVSVAIINLTKIPKISSPPKILRTVCNPYFARFLGIGKIRQLQPTVDKHSRLEEETLEMSTSDNMDVNLVMDGGTDDLSISSQWILIASVVNRICLIVYSILSIVLFFLCIV